MQLEWAIMLIKSAIICDKDDWLKSEYGNTWHMKLVSLLVILEYSISCKVILYILNT